MDPDEYADTLAKDPDSCLNAGELEMYLKEDKFQLLDLGEHVDEINLEIYNLREAMARWVEIGFGNLALCWDEQAVKMSEHKVAYTEGRRALAAMVKAFTLAHLSEKCEGGDGTWRKECEDLIAEFKRQFDSLSANARFTEVSFLSTYRLMRSAEDPTIVIEKCIKVCIHAQDALKIAQEQLNLANHAINGSVGGGSMRSFSLSGASIAAVGRSGAPLHELEARERQHSKEKEELEQRMKEEIADLRTRFEVEMRSRENSIRSSFERHQMEMQASHEELLARKDAEVQSLLANVSNSSQRAAEAEERGISLQVEVAKRRELEDRLRAALTEAADAQTVAREFQTKFEDTLCHAQAVEARAEMEMKKSTHDVALLQAELHAAREAVTSLEQEMAHRPPVDLSSLAETLGTELRPEKGNKFQWAEIESFVRENVRRINAEAAESRVQALDVTGKLVTLEEECTRLRCQVQQKDDEVAGLERDLMAAQSIIDSNKALLKCGVGSNSSGGGDDVRVRELVDSGTTAGKSHTPIKAPSSTFQARSPRAGQTELIALSQLGGDLEKGAGGSGTALLIGNLDGSARMMQALQAQRDRYMKTARDKENELNVVKGRLDRMQEEQLTLRSDNLELYRRLRVLRVSKGDDMEENAPSKGKRRDARSVGGGGIFSTVVGERSSEAMTAPGDALDGKYTRLYESHIDPFKFEEVDRQLVISRLNILERGLAHLSRFLLQDRWARHALIVYLLLVHFFAMGYVLQILNPQLVEEVDSLAKQRFAASTFDSGEIEPDW